mgnify:CR=1 FL=1
MIDQSTICAIATAPGSGAIAIIRLSGKDSINIGIDAIKRYNIKVTKRSTNLIKELRNYRYDKERQDTGY